MTNETPICFSITGNANTKNEIQIRFWKWWENEKQKLKFKSPFQSAAKTKNEKRKSNPFFNVTSRQKTKNRNGNGIPFYKAEEKRKIKMKFECHFFYAIEKRLALRYTHWKGSDLYAGLKRTNLCLSLTSGYCVKFSKLLEIIQLSIKKK